MERLSKTLPGPCGGTPQVVDNGEPWQTVCLACGWDASEHENNQKPKQAWRYKDLAWMRIARFAAEELSTCGKRQYCAIILGADTSVVGMGYNGGPSGMTHCKDGGCQRLQEGSAPGSNYDNCFHGDVEFLTREGVRTLQSMSGEITDVLTSMGWKEAKIESFGVQPMMKVALRRHSDRKEIIATPDHRWFTYDSHRVKHEVLTKHLVSGHCLAHAHARTGTFKSSIEGKLAGLVFGDGSAMYDQSGSGAFIQMCGAKNAELNHLWGDREFTVLTNGDRRYGNLPRRWKTELPPLDESFGYLYGWLQGYFAADGTISHATPILYSARREHLEWAQQICYVLGIPTLDIKVQSRLGYGNEPSDLYRLPIPQGALEADFFLLTSHREKAASRSRKRNMPRWTVESVESLPFESMAYCAVVPGHGEFTLTGNILTGNCFAIHAEENALIRSSPERRAGGTLLVNGAPCYGCAKKMCNANLRRIVVIDDPSYQAAQQGYDLMRRAGLELIILDEELFV